MQLLQYVYRDIPKFIYRSRGNLHVTITVSHDSMTVREAKEGLRRLVQNNFEFTESTDAQLIRRSRIMQTNPINDYLMENCLFKKGIRVFSANLYSRYLDYCRSNALNYVSHAPHDYWMWNIHVQNSPEKNILFF